MVDDPQTCEEDLPEPSAENPDIESDDGGENLEDKDNEDEDREKSCQSTPWEPTLLVLLLPFFYRRSNNKL